MLGFVVEWTLCLWILGMFRCLPGRKEVATVVCRVLEEEYGSSGRNGACSAVYIAI
jgi:hypothetical protein